MNDKIRQMREELKDKKLQQELIKEVAKQCKGIHPKNPLQMTKMEISSGWVNIWFNQDVPADRYNIGDEAKITEDGEITVIGIIADCKGNHMLLARTLKTDIDTFNYQVAKTWQLIKAKIRGFFTGRG